MTSPANPRVKRAAGLRRAHERQETGLTLVDGVRELTRAAAAGVEIVAVFVAADAPDPGRAAARGGSRWSPTIPGGGEAWLSVRNRVDLESHDISTTPVGPFRCLARMSSATPTLSGFCSSHSGSARW
ncbi:MAG: hypothetical protein ACO396_01670 [Phycisphaerales bacterium]